MARKPTAVIDVGSNSVRLVVFSGNRRVPMPIFNEKVLAGLGASLAKTGAITAESGEKALRALTRFKLLVDHIGAGRTHLLATAAVRDASNGPQFAKEIRSLGLPCRVLAPEEEAVFAGLGVISAIPWANGIAGDLGGGSLELVEVADGRTSKPCSLPLGVLRFSDRKAARDMVRKAVESAGWSGQSIPNFYMVGGSWRSLARIDMIDRGYPLPILQQFRMPAQRAHQLCTLVESADPRWSEAIAPARLASSPVAAMLLSTVVDELKPDRLITSTYGIREGLLYSTLGPKQRLLDPLVCAARDLSHAESPTGAHGDCLDEWMAGAFDDAPKLARVRLAACLLADAAWRATPLFRADRAIELALHGNWVAIDPPRRVLLAQALAAGLGKEQLADQNLLQMCKPKELRRAREWGLAIRTGQRLSGGIASVLRETRLEVRSGKLVLQVHADEAGLVSEGVNRRLNRLAAAMQLEPAVDLN